MLEAVSYRQVCEKVASAFERRCNTSEVPPAVRMVGLLFSRPEVPLASTQIVPSLDYFHYRSGEHIDFFCAGYGRYWYPRVARDQKRVTDDDPPWLFSTRLFERLRRDVETHTNWKYSGEADLILLNAEYDYAYARLDHSTAIVCDLSKMVLDGAIVSVHRFFEQIFQYAERSTGSDPTWGFSDRMGVQAGSSALKRLLLSFLPRDLGGDYQRAEAFAVRDIGKRFEL